MISADSIFALYEQRKRRLTPRHARMIEMRDTHGGTLVLPLPEIDATERPAVANLVLQGIEQHGMRIASTMPSVYYPPVHPGVNASEEHARDRQLVTRYWWYQTRLKLKMQRRARQLVAYGTAPVVIRPNFRTGIPEWKIRDPIGCYPPEMDTGELVPSDVIFSYMLPYAQIRRDWPDSALAMNRAAHAGDDTTYMILEYIDAAELVLVACGDKHVPHRTGSSTSGEAVILERIENRTGRPLAVIPGRISLEGDLGQFDGMVGFYQAQAKLFALEMLGAQRSVWPETWLVANGVQEARIIQYADPLRGQVGKIEGGTLTVVRQDPSQLGLQAVDRLERAQRLQGGIPAEFGGESASNVRTGRRGDAIMSAVVDFPVQLAHQVFEESLQEENRIAAAIDRAYFDTTKSVYVSGTKGTVTYRPGDTWENDTNYVRYSNAGADLNRLVIEAGQRIGLGTLSKRGFMEVDPLVEDPEQMGDAIKAEQLEDALLASMQARAQQDPTFVGPLAEIIKEVRTNKGDLADVYLRVDERYRKAQAAAAAAAQNVPSPAGMPSPEGQPGLVEPVPTIGKPEPSLGNMSRMLADLVGSQRTGG